jgi:putative membrane protein
MTRKVYFSALVAGFLVLWVALAFSPNDRADWLLENALLLVGVGVLIATRKALPLSGVSYTCILVFFCLHTIGALLPAARPHHVLIDAL